MRPGAEQRTSALRQ